MVNLIWLLLIVCGILYAGMTGNIEVVTGSAISAAEDAVNIAIKLTGVMCLWLGIMKIAERSGIIRCIAYILSPVIRIIFPDVPKNHPALGAIIMTLSANMLGMGNAVTPLGIKAMQELQKLNAHKHAASPSMCTLLALCTTGFTLVPATIIGLRSAAGSENASEIIGSTILVSLFATLVVLFADFICRSIYSAHNGR